MTGNGVVHVEAVCEAPERRSVTALLPTEKCTKKMLLHNRCYKEKQLVDCKRNKSKIFPPCRHDTVTLLRGK